jgi:hypothetical protein
MSDIDDIEEAERAAEASMTRRGGGGGGGRKNKKPKEVTTTKTTTTKPAAVGVMQANEEQLRRMVTEKDITIQDLTKRIQNLQYLIDSAQSDHKECERLVDSLKRQLAENNASEVLDDALANSEKLTRENIILRNKLEDAKSRLERAGKQDERQARTIQDLKSQIAKGGSTVEKDRKIERQQERINILEEDLEVLTRLLKENGIDQPPTLRTKARGIFAVGVPTEETHLSRAKLTSRLTEPGGLPKSGYKLEVSFNGDARFTVPSIAKVGNVYATLINGDVPHRYSSVSKGMRRDILRSEGEIRIALLDANNQVVKTEYGQYKADTNKNERNYVMHIGDATVYTNNLGDALRIHLITMEA